MIVFQNPGALDWLAITMMGLTSKADDDDKIGRFGTGLKYALAVIARGGGDVEIYNKGERARVEVATGTFRGRPYKGMGIVGDNSAIPLPFTTDLGRDWKPWQAFRELYANAKDECGHIQHHEDDHQIESEDGLVSIAVKWRPFDAIFFSLEEHFIPDDSAPIWASDTLEVFEGPSKFVFHNNIAVHEMPEPARFRYNIKGHLALTEDRTAAYHWQVKQIIALALSTCTDGAICKEAVNGENSFEGSLDYVDDGSDEPSSAFLGAAAAGGNKTSASAATRLVMAAPTTPGTFTCAAPGTPGASNLQRAVGVLRRAGGDLDALRFVLAPDVHIGGHYMVKGTDVLLSPEVFEDQGLMTAAVLSAYNAFRPDWLLSVVMREFSESEKP